jgi:hypothetical protein
MRDSRLIVQNQFHEVSMSRLRSISNVVTVITYHIHIYLYNIGLIVTEYHTSKCYSI